MRFENHRKEKRNQLRTLIASIGLPIHLLKSLPQGISGDFMSVVSVKIPKRVKEKMKEYGDVVNWPEEIRGSIIAKIEEVERSRALEEAIKLLEGIPSTPRGTARSLVREDRDSH